MKKIVKGVITKVVWSLPNCMFERTGCKYICPRYWIVSKAGAKELWNRGGWVLCVKEWRRRFPR